RTIPQAVKALRPGGSAVVMGLHAAKEDVPIPAGPLVFQNKSLLGSYYGSARPGIDLPLLVELYRAGRLPVDQLIAKRYRLEELPQSFEDMEPGNGGRGVIMFP